MASPDFDLHSLHFAFTRRSASSRYLCSSRGLEWPVAFKALSSLTSFVSSLHCLSCPSVQCGFTFLSPLACAPSPTLAPGAAFPRGWLECPLAALLRKRHCDRGRSTGVPLPARSGSLADPLRLTSFRLVSTLPLTVPIVLDKTFIWYKAGTPKAVLDGSGPRFWLVN
jgi:hypothetical protein